MFDLLERQQRLTTNQWKIFFAVVLGDMLDFFDFFLIGYVLAFLVRSWHLTFGQSAMILLAAGIGAVFGALFWGWMADRIGRRKVFIATALNFSFATGIMALTPTHGGWLFLTVLRFFVGFGVAGLFAVDMPLLQEFVPASKRGWISGISQTLIPLGSLIGAVIGGYLGPVIGWRGLFAIGLLPALFTLLIRVWVPESPRWLIRMGRSEEARKSLAWALQLPLEAIELPSSVPEVQKTEWRELFRYPRSVVAGCLTGISLTGSAGLLLWATTLFMLVLKISPAEASKLMIWVGLSGILGRFFCSFLSDILGRRPAGVLVGLISAVTLALAGYVHDAFIGPVSAFFLIVVVHTFFGNGSLAITGGYMAEIWPARLRASGLGLVYGFANLGKIIGPLGLALIVGTSNYVSPKATVAAIVPAFYFLAFWYVLGALAYWLVAFETKGRTIEEIDAALTEPMPVEVPVRS